MEPITRHLSAMQTAAAASIVTAALLALPLLAANDAQVTGQGDSFYAQHIVLLFQKTGAQVPGTFDNLSLETSGFDFAAYVSHTCFRPTENDLAACSEEFGPFANLKTTYDSGTLNRILQSTPYLIDAAAFAPTLKKEEIVEPSVENKTIPSDAQPTPSEAMIRERSVMLWKECQIKEPTREAASRCYQRNIRRTQEGNENAEGNVY